MDISENVAITKDRRVVDLIGRRIHNIRNALKLLVNAEYILISLDN